MVMIKQKNYRSKKLLDAARDCPCCMMCDKPNDGTIVAAHYQGFRQHALGKGTGIKPSDAAAAFICSECHDMVDGRTPGASQNQIERSEEFLFAVVKTHDYLLSEGVMNV